MAIKPVLYGIILGCFVYQTVLVMSNEGDIYEDVEEQLEKCKNLDDIINILRYQNTTLEDQKTALERGLQDKKSVIEDKMTVLEDKMTALERGLQDLGAKIDSLSKPDTCEHHHGTVVLRSGLEVVCDGGWIVIQRRMSAQVSFNRNWTDYKIGFGDVQGNFWAGLESIHELTSRRRHEVRFEFTYNNKSYFADYGKFVVAGESDNYRLTISGYDNSSTAGDYQGMSWHNGMQFSTPDRDNDRWRSGNCAASCSGAWWFNSCQYVNFNGIWGRNDYKGLIWYEVTRHNSATSTAIKIRPL